MKSYWDSLSKNEQIDLAKRAKSSPGYLRLIFNGYKKAGYLLAQRIEKETKGIITRATLRPDIYPKQ
ncbi:transcriptional regulator [Budviciaceae bacterium BWR-B9]|uniref:Transcriptional regulator n=1 Tax=Limnobaculum allomyrinae TaxID=2791986 RepID=A0ABS1IWB0_9GAMM|nr:MULTISPECIES: helix-turn-helix domain-containing protein [Limnobaculum]MBK5146034.1 transcriptional regulator [Limnobaculum allomyrinae]MBV7694079.1 helix-turn-helix domain-containing protein [Limnobaculum sp. M2-1]